MEVRIEMLNRYLTGWCGYFALAITPSKFKEFDEWIRRRLRIQEQQEQQDQRELSLLRMVMFLTRERKR
jgi:hypothetical protein